MLGLPTSSDVGAIGGKKVPPTQNAASESMNLQNKVFQLLQNIND